MSGKQTYSIELSESMHAFLAEITRQYKLPSVDKAVRCLVNFAREDPKRHAEIFSEIRCIDCGG